MLWQTFNIYLVKCQNRCAMRCLFSAIKRCYFCSGSSSILSSFFVDKRESDSVRQ